MTLSTHELQRYQRHMDVPSIGYAGQKKIKAARVLIVGLGGLGSPLAVYLTTSGIGKLGLVDHDHVDLSNLHRQILYTESDIGQSKAQCAQHTLQQLNSYCTIQSYSQKITADTVEAILNDYDIIADCTDNFATRYLINQSVAQLNKTLVTAAVNQFEGHVAVFPKNARGCYHCLFGLVDSSKIKNCATAGVLATTAGILGTLQAQHILNYILQPTTQSHFLKIDTQNFSVKKFALADATCTVCAI